MRIFRRVATAAAALLAGWLGSAGAVGAAPALWRASSDHAQVYLFGTLHALQPQAAASWRTPAYDAALAAADTVWFEADLSQATPAAIGAILARYGVDPDHTLSQKLSRDDLARLARQADLARIEHLRPWAAALMLSVQPMLSQGGSVEAGADAQATRQAQTDAKRIRTFETLEDQAKLFADLAEPAEVAYLSQVIRERATQWPKIRIALHQAGPAGGPGGGPAGAQSGLERAWLDGDLARLGPALVGNLEAQNPVFYEALLKRRNLAWAETLTRELQTAHGTELVNVGALHMMGEDGLPALLAARGFKVERVQ